MKMSSRFDPQTFASLVGGTSVMDIPQLKIQNLEEAHSFVRSYGFDINKLADEKKLWNYHRRAVTYLRSELLFEGEVFPETLSDPNQLKDICNILVFASTSGQKNRSLQKWACAILKVMHALVHLENDVFYRYSSEIQSQVIKPFEKSIFNDGITGTFLGPQSDENSIQLKKFDIKSFKSSDSSVTKLLAKPEAVAFTILDKIGMRFVTKHLFDVFRVMHFLVKNHLVSFPHNIPDQSNNTLYPVNLFFETIESLQRNKDYDLEDLDAALANTLKSNEAKAQYKEKLNSFSAKDYKFIKFISRRLVAVEGSDGSMNRFFYPFEIQIVDYETYLNNLSGTASHDDYKQRQRERARIRVFGRDWAPQSEAEEI